MVSIAIKEYSDTYFGSIGDADNFTLESGTEQYGFVNILEKSTSDTITFVLIGLLLPIVAFLGIIGNILSIIVLSQKKMHASLTLLLIGLSLCDLFVCALQMTIKGLPFLLKALSLRSTYFSLICSSKKITHALLLCGNFFKLIRYRNRTMAKI